MNITIETVNVTVSGVEAVPYLETIIEGVQNMSEALDRLKAEVTQNNDAVKSAIASITGMAQTIRDLKDDPVALAELADALDAQSNDLVAAVVANTPTDLPTV